MNFGVLYKYLVIVRLKIYGESVWLLVEACHKSISPPTVLKQNGPNLKPKTFRIAIFSYGKEGF
jgi:hypothetical protein